MQERVYCAYIVASRSHTLYIGVTGNLLKRVFEHKQKKYEGFSATYNCNRLVWFERFTGPNSATAREKQLKGWIRAKKIALIEKDNPTWNDLSEGWWAVDPTIDKSGEPLQSSRNAQKQKQEQPRVLRLRPPRRTSLRMTVNI
jgi:putative endonuclease